MAKAVFRPGEAKNIEEKVMLPLYKDYSPVEETIEEVEEEYTGPTADDLRREAEEYRATFEREKQQMLTQAQEEANRIIKGAEDTAFAEVKRQTDQAAIIKADAESEANAIIEKAKAEAAQTVAEKYLKQKDDVLETSLKWISYDDLDITEEQYNKLTEKVKEYGLSDNPPAYADFVKTDF